MSRQKRSRRKGRRRRLIRPTWLSVAADTRRRLLGRTVIGLVIVVVLVGMMVGLHRLERVARQHDRFLRPADLHLLNAPPGIQTDLLTALEPVRETAWGDPNLCRDIGVILENNPWVARVRSVRKHGTGRVDIDCRYREPVALVRGNQGLHLVTRDAIRLPGQYAYDPSLLVIEGVAVAPPPAGRVWEAPALRAGLAVADRLDGEPFAAQITGVLVDNYGGRIDKEAAHIRLATDRPGGTIIWGSAPGEELEETTASEKIAILRENFRRYGRVDAQRQTIDISIHPQRFMTPA